MGHVIVETQSREETSLKMSKKLSFRLPDGETEVWIHRSGNSTGMDYVVGSGDGALARWTSDGTQTRLSPAMVNDDNAEFGEVIRLQLLSLDMSGPRSPFWSHGQQQDIALAWASVYALWLHPDRRDDDLIAVSVDSERVGEYFRDAQGWESCLRCRRSQEQQVQQQQQQQPKTPSTGSPARRSGKEQHWLQSRPEVTSFPGFNRTLGVFASQMGFTRKGNVCTVHPVRPPKPKPGAVIYSRFIVEVGQLLRILHIDAENPVHFEAYKRWQNSDRVNASWKERGPDEHHRAYLAGQLADAHSMSCVFEWDGELAGYTQLGWVKEDNAACFFSSNCNIVVGEHDQNSHIIVGEEHFRGGKRYQAVATSIKHCCFLRDPRTKQVIAEPRFDLAHVHIQSRYLPQERKKRFHLPHKTAVLFALQRDRFFQDAHLV
ncbi:hypothetical protein QQZ08_007577 [Neonectria magnoliae]|uniref:Acyltransferase MbtK/IucB-like conserved domain-containing protein n=1 Tax=Neonectria magnoliae TaxID=2732573 RepID=A0ABR1HXJ4_9HYPO